MKMSNYLVEIAGVSIYPIISLLLFVVFFVGVLVWVFFMDKNKVNYIANLPFGHNEKDNHSSNQSS
ncbi:MAG: CcoQ/FixQ family Cbb3-type cytochrome c oxidase assembly chaperone [Chitinophagales bacterium]|nr:CcoQ/FixQ family Cbb3-type cytochrome c oxidase assembly chaperone [Chitinophagales bacterium]